MTNQSVQTQPRNMTSRDPMMPKQNKSRRFQVQWDPTQSRGQMRPEQFQGYPSQTRDQTFMQMQYQKSPSQWASQEGELGPTQSGGQMASAYYQKSSSQLRDQKKKMQMQYPINPSQWRHHESLQLRSQDFSKYPRMRGQVKPSQIQYARNPSQWGRQDDMQYRNQADSEYLEMRGQMNSNQLQYARNPTQRGRQEDLQLRNQDNSEYPQIRDQVNPNQIQYARNPSQWERQDSPQFRRQSDPEDSQIQYQTSSFQFGLKMGSQFRNQDSKDNLQPQTKTYKVHLRQHDVTTLPTTSSTQWNDWVPPHKLIHSSEAEAEKEREKWGSDSPDWEGWTGSNAASFRPGWHPNNPKYDYIASVTGL